MGIWFLCAAKGTRNTKDSLGPALASGAECAPQFIVLVLQDIKIIRTRRCGSDYSSLVRRKGLEPPTY